MDWVNVVFKDTHGSSLWTCDKCLNIPTRQDAMLAQLLDVQQKQDLIIELLKKLSYAHDENKALSINIRPEQFLVWIEMTEELYGIIGINMNNDENINVTLFKTTYKIREDPCDESYGTISLTYYPARSSILSYTKRYG